MLLLLVLLLRNSLPCCFNVTLSGSLASLCPARNTCHFWLDLACQRAGARGKSHLGKFLRGKAQIGAKMLARLMILWVFLVWPLEFASGAGVFYHADGIGSTKALSDQNGKLLDSYQYDAYGAVESHTGTTVNPYRYTGEYFDDAISLQYNRARWYAPAVGRFVSLDPFLGVASAPVSLHKYIYANGDPVDFSDPSGLFIGIDNFTAAYGRTKQARENYQTYSNIVQSLCKTANTLGKTVHGHHALPQFMGGIKKETLLVDLPESVHSALHKLLTFGLLINDFPGPNKNKYKKTFSNPQKKQDALEILYDVSVYIDTACKPVVPGYNEIAPVIDVLIKLGRFVF
jgi:RHS repeat-associated protein